MSMQTMDVCTSTSTGTGTTKTTLNGGSAYTIPSDIVSFSAIAPVQAATGAYTAAESVETVFFMESSDVTGLDPKRYAIPTTIGGLSTIFEPIVPILNVVPLNVNCRGQQRVTFSGQSMTANTAAFRVGANLFLSKVPAVGRQLYFDVPFSSGNPTSTSTGTAAARVAGTAFTETDTVRLVGCSQRIYPGVITASESYIGRGEIICDGFVDPTPLMWFNQPIGTGLGATQGVQIPGDFDAGVDPSVWYGKIQRAFRQKSTNTITNFYNQDEALTGAGTFCTQLFLTKQ